VAVSLACRTNQELERGRTPLPRHGCTSQRKMGVARGGGGHPRAMDDSNTLTPRKRQTDTHAHIHTPTHVHARAHARTHTHPRAGSAHRGLPYRARPGSASRLLSARATPHPHAPSPTLPPQLEALSLRANHSPQRANQRANHSPQRANCQLGRRVICQALPQQE